MLVMEIMKYLCLVYFDEKKLDEITGVVDQYRTASQYALVTGFDGVEIHAANGYLIDQFLRDGTNHRTDRYGGSLVNRVRFMLEVTEAVTEVWGTDRVGVRISPVGAFNDMSDSDPETTFNYVAGQLNRFGLVPACGRGRRVDGRDTRRTHA